MDKKTVKSNSKLWLILAGIIIAVIFAMMLLFGIFFAILFSNGIIPSDKPFESVGFLGLIFIALVLGVILSVFISRLILRPIVELSKAMRKVAEGDFSTRIDGKSKFSEITDMYENFNTMAQELSGIETLRSDFVVNVSHEFKTPIAAIEGYATLLQSENLTKEQHDSYVDKIINNAHSLSDLTGNILKLSKLENQELITDKKQFLLDEQIRQTVLALESSWTEKNIEFDIDLPTIKYYGNDALLYQVWYNLINNAIKFSHNGGTIKLFMTIRDDLIYAYVEDNGIGMDAETQKHIFEKFYQGDKTHKAEGNGLGLALVKRIIDLCGGSITVKSELGKGSKFTVTLPINEN